MHWRLRNVGTKVDRAGVLTHDPWIDSSLLTEIQRLGSDSEYFGCLESADIVTFHILHGKFYTFAFENSIGPDKPYILLTQACYTSLSTCVNSDKTEQVDNMICTYTVQKCQLVPFRMHWLIFYLFSYRLKIAVGKYTVLLVNYGTWMACVHFQVKTGSITPLGWLSI